MTPTSTIAQMLWKVRVYLAQGDAPAEEVLPPLSPRKYWTRRGVAEWLAQRLDEDPPTIVGIVRISAHRGRRFQPIVDGISDERGRCFKLIVDGVSA